MVEGFRFVVVRPPFSAAGVAAALDLAVVMVPHFLEHGWSGK